MNVDKLISDTLTLATFTSLSALMEVPLDFGGWLVTEMTHWITCITINGVHAQRGKLSYTHI